MKVKVAAKLNLSLNVNPIVNGMHPLDSVAVSVDLFDEVEVVLRKDSVISVRGVASVKEENNSAYRAASEFCRVFGGGCDITIKKGIPEGAGLGGSSADAAAAAYCLSRLNGVDSDCGKIAEICAAAGSDVNFMLTGGLGRMTGRGEITEFFPFDGTLYFVLTLFPHIMSTAEVFRRFDFLPQTAPLSDNDALLRSLLGGDISSAKLNLGNFLTAAVRDISDYAESYLSFCRSHRLRTVMTGSGSAFFVLCVNGEEAENVCTLLQNAGYCCSVRKSLSRSVWEI